MMDKVLEPLARRVRLAIGRGIVKLVNDAAGVQKIQLSLMANETRSKIERFQEYGFTSVPLPGAEAAAIFVGGNRDHGIIIATEDRRYRLQGLEGGEVALYSDEGDSIIFKRGNKIEVNTETLNINASTEVKIESPLVRVSGNIIDNYATNSNNMGNMRDIYNSHTHDENDSGGPTEPPNEEM